MCRELREKRGRESLFAKTEISTSVIERACTRHLGTDPSPSLRMTHWGERIRGEDEMGRIGFVGRSFRKADNTAETF